MSPPPRARPLRRAHKRVGSKEILAYIATQDEGIVTADIAHHFDMISRDVSAILLTAVRTDLVRTEKFEERGRQLNRYFITQTGRERIEETTQLAMETN
jgi:DNA-binding MarR family transcriptional regulator